MGLRSAISRFLFGPPRREPQPVGDAAPRVVIRGSYDAASVTGVNANHWAAADALDADSANSKAVRQRIAYRARYEVANNGQGKGVQLTQANYVVGRGPKLRMQTGDAAFNTEVETEWTSWAKEAKLARQLRTMIKAKVGGGGEGFAIIAQNPAMRHEVKLGLRGVECEQVTTPYLNPMTPNRIDGVEFDDFGNATSYDVLRYHPGGAWAYLRQDPDPIPARFVLHLFREDRAGQHRGVDELSASLNVFAQSRRFKEATLTTAELIALLTVLLKTPMPPDGSADFALPMSTLDLQKGTMTALPSDTEPWQPDVKQPGPGYSEFTQQQDREQARPINMPRNIAAADSSGYSFSGGKLDHTTYFVSVDVEQSEIEEEVLDKLFQVWFAEANLRFGWGRPEYPLPAHTWDWPRKPVIDEAKTATARKTDLSTGADDFVHVCTTDGVDAEERIATMARTYGVTVEEMRAVLLKAHFGGGQGAAPEPDPQDPDQADDAERQAANTNGRSRLPVGAGRNGNGRSRA